jgi:hypothetical protein
LPGWNAAARRAVFLLFALASFCLLGGRPSQAATMIWTNISGGSWLVPQNWNPNQVPAGLTDTAVITNSGTYTVALGSGLAIANITLGAAGGTGIQTLSWSGGTVGLQRDDRRQRDA